MISELERLGGEILACLKISPNSDAFCCREHRRDIVLTAFTDAFGIPEGLVRICVRLRCIQGREHASQKESRVQTKKEAWINSALPLPEGVISQW